MQELSAELSPTLVDCVIEYVAREGGRTAVAAWRERVTLPAGTGDGAERPLTAEAFAELLRGAADVLLQPDAAERIGHALPVLLKRDVFATLVRGAQRVPAAYRELPHLFEVIDPTSAVEVDFVGRNRVQVRFSSREGSIPAELAALHRGVLSSLPAFLDRPPAVVQVAQDGGGHEHVLVATFQRPPLRLEALLGLAAGLVLGVALFAYTGLHEDAELLTLPLRMLGLTAMTVLGLVFGLRQRLANDLQRQATLVEEQNTGLRDQISSLRRNREDLRRARRRLEDEVRARTRELELKRERIARLLDLSHDLNATLDLETILDVAMVRIPSILSARLTSIYLLDPATARLDLVAHNLQGAASPPGFGSDPSGVPAPASPIERSGRGTTAGDPDPAAPGWLMRRVIAEEQPLLVCDVEGELGRARQPRYRTSSCMVLLLRSGGGIIGVLNVADSDGNGAFDESRFQLAKIIGEHLGTAISNARLLRQTQLLSITDGLTGLYLHRHFQETLEREVERARRYERPLSLLLLDVDQFKSLNDRFGHPTGDDVLRGVAAVLRAQLRSSDLPARYGGDEFAAILPQTSLAGARAFAERIRSALRRMRIDRPEAIPMVTVSIGVCEYDPEWTRADLVESADRALYRAKAEGRDRVSVWTPPRALPAGDAERRAGA